MLMEKGWCCKRIQTSNTRARDQSQQAEYRKQSRQPCTGRRGEQSNTLAGDQQLPPTPRGLHQVQVPLEYYLSFTCFIVFNTVYFRLLVQTFTIFSFSSLFDYHINIFFQLNIYQNNFFFILSLYLKPISLFCLHTLKPFINKTVSEGQDHDKPPP